MGHAKEIALLVVALFLAGCGHGSRVADRNSQRPAGLVFVDSRAGIAAVDAASGAVAWDEETTLASPGYQRLYRTTEGNGAHLLVSLDASDGARRSAIEIPSGLTAVVASTSGRSVALIAQRALESRYPTSGRSRTRIVVARPDEGDVRTYDLHGNFEPEAFSTDDRKLFLIEYLPGDSGRYRVRMMRLTSGAVLSLGRLTKTAPDSMQGAGRVHEYSPDGDVLYTLYTRQPPNYAHRSRQEVHDKGMVHAFIHVLNLREGWAHCVDLPMPFGLGKRPADMLAVSPDGRFVYAGDGDRIATVATKRLRVTGSAASTRSPAAGRGPR